MAARHRPLTIFASANFLSGSFAQRAFPFPSGSAATFSYLCAIIKAHFPQYENRHISIFLMEGTEYYDFPICDDEELKDAISMCKVVEDIIRMKIAIFEDGFINPPTKVSKMIECRECKEVIRGYLYRSVSNYDHYLCYQCKTNHGPGMDGFNELLELGPPYHNFLAYFLPSSHYKDGKYFSVDDEGMFSPQLVISKDEQAFYYYPSARYVTSEDGRMGSQQELVKRAFQKMALVEKKPSSHITGGSYDPSTATLSYHTEGQQEDTSSSNDTEYENGNGLHVIQEEDEPQSSSPDQESPDGEQNGKQEDGAQNPGAQSGNVKDDAVVRYKVIPEIKISSVCSEEEEVWKEEVPEQSGQEEEEVQKEEQLPEQSGQEEDEWDDAYGKIYYV